MTCVTFTVHRSPAACRPGADPALVSGSTAWVGRIRRQLFRMSPGPRRAGGCARVPESPPSLLCGSNPRDQTRGSSVKNSGSSGTGPADAPISTQPPSVIR